MPQSLMRNSSGITLRPFSVSEYSTRGGISSNCRRVTMPLIVDKEAIKLQILEAFNRLSDDRPLTDISLREIAAEAGMSHTKVLRYFSSKNSLHAASVHWASSFLCAAVDEWFSTHDAHDYPSRWEYLDALFSYIAGGTMPGITPRNIVMLNLALIISGELLSFKHNLPLFASSKSSIF